MSSYREADEVIRDLAAAGYDYSSKREEIEQLFEQDLYNGNYDSSTDFDGDLPDLRLIQEDEYEQSMSARERPKNPVCYSSGHYVFLA